MAKQGVDKLTMKLGDHLYMNPNEGSGVLKLKMVDLPSSENDGVVLFDIDYADGSEDVISIENDSDSNEQTVYIHSKHQVRLDEGALTQAGVTLNSSNGNSWEMSIASLELDLTIQWVDHSPDIS